MAAKKTASRTKQTRTTKPASRTVSAPPRRTRKPTQKKAPAESVSVPVVPVDGSVLTGSTGEGPRAKQFGIPESHVVRLEPAYFPSDAEWLRTSVGLVVGIALKSAASISYNPAPLPKMRITKLQVIAEMSAEQPDTQAYTRLIVLNREGNPLAIGDPAKAVPLEGFPRVEFNIPPEQVASEGLITVALEVKPADPTKRAIVRAVWARVEG